MTGHAAGQAREPGVTGLLARDPHVISAGLDLLASAVRAQAGRVTQVEWAPPMPGTEANLTPDMLDA